MTAELELEIGIMAGLKEEVRFTATVEVGLGLPPCLGSGSRAILEVASGLMAVL